MSDSILYWVPDHVLEQWRANARKRWEEWQAQYPRTAYEKLEPRRTRWDFDDQPHRSIAIWSARENGCKYRVIAEAFDISTNRARQIYMREERRIRLETDTLRQLARRIVRCPSPSKKPKPL